MSDTLSPRRPAPAGPPSRAADRSDGAAAVLADIEALRAAVDREGRETLARWRPDIRRRAFLPSALNLAHYLAFRRRDLRGLQESLMPLGLSSLGRAEARVLPNLDAIRASLARIVGRPDPPAYPPPRRFGNGLRLLARNTNEVFGPASGERQVRIMVTLGAGSADDPEGVERAIAAGANAVRINCAHDDAQTWRAAVANVRRAEARTGKTCRVCMDLCGPRARTGAVAPLPDREVLVAGDRLLLTPPQGGDASGPDAAEAAPAFRAACSLAAALDRVEVGHRVAIDEGACVARAVERRGDAVLLTVEHAGAKGFRLKTDKGLNFPDTALDIPALTSKDLADLDTVAAIADIVGYSFVQRPDDLAALRRALGERRADRPAPAILAKIETALAVRNLPELIVAGAGRQPFAVMIARGDLAVEIGYQRLAEIQEELLWLCEAAHVPVVWATQVLDSFVKRGAPSRAEVTDAAMAERAECVMLNKGAFQAEAVCVLDEMLGRMAAHQSKKTSRLRALQSW